MAMLGFATVASAQSASQIEQVRRDESLERATGGNVLLPDGKMLVPQLFEDELEDIGPQYLLLEKPKKKYFEIGSDLQFYRTSNVNLLEDAERSTIMAWTGDVAIAPEPWDRWDGKLKLRMGYRHKIYRYGIGDDTEKVANGARVDLSDFDARNPYLDLSYKRGPWTFSAGLRYNNLLSARTGSGFYEEWSPSIGVSRTLHTTDSSALSLSYTLLHRFSETPLGLQEETWNTRTEQSLNLSYSRLLSEKWICQLLWMGQHAHYVHSNRDRDDFTSTFMAMTGYFFNDWLSARAFASYERRETSEDISADYEKADIGLAGSLQLRF